MPANFAPKITLERVRGAVVWVWRETLIVDGMPVKLEYGMRHDDRQAMVQKIWELHEHARLGNHHDLSHARADRHQKRPRLLNPQPVPAPFPPA